MIMRYQRISPDSLAMSNGRRSNSTPNSNWKTCKEDEDRVEIYGNVTMKTSSTFEGKGLSRFRSPSKTSQDHHIGNGNGVIASEVPNSPPTITAVGSSRNHHQNLESNGVVGGGGDNFLQWGHRKRSRCSRGTALTDETSPSTSAAAQFQSTKIQRRSLPQSSSSPNANLMPPPSLPSSNGITKRPTLKPPTKDSSYAPSPVRRNNLEERSATKSPPGNTGGGGSNSRAVSSRSRAGKRSPSLDKKNPSSSAVLATRDEKMNGCSSLQQQHHHQEAVTSDVNHIVSPSQQGGCGSSINNDDNNYHVNDNAARTAKLAGTGGGGEKVVNGGSGEVNEWPRIYIPLSRKEKEEDFLAMKGTKLPHRPKKRPKTVERMLQYCFPGMWLSDLSRGRYEVREKKCPRKQQKRRGLKGMESMESDSE